MNERGDISIYITLLVGLMILGSAVLVSLILARQLTLTQDLVASERAYYAANAGVEEGFYRLAIALRTSPGGDIDPLYAPGQVEYVQYNPIQVAHYEESTDNNNIQLIGGVVCGYIRGRFAEEQRFIFVGQGACH